MDKIVALRTLLEPHDLTFFAGAPYVYHCHHYNLFHDQTLDDVMGEERSFVVRKNAAHAAFGDLLERIVQSVDATTPAERAAIAESLLCAIGHGRIALDATAEGGKAHGTHMHYGFAWSEKYGAKVKRLDPADAVGAGYAAAAVEVANGLPLGTLDAEEKSCIAMRDPRCEFEITKPAAPLVLPPSVSEEDYVAQLSASVGGKWEEKIGTIADGLQKFVASVGGDDRGVVQAFGVFVTLHLANYYNETGYAAIRHAERNAPASAPAVEALLREAGHVCVFNTFGNILLSPEWEGMVGPLSGAPDEIVMGCAAIARGLGFGRWAIGEFEEGKRLVLRASSNYEAPWYAARFGETDRPRCYFFEGAALAFMVLAHRVKWTERPQLTQGFYDKLFHGGLGWHSEFTKCRIKGEEYTEVVITPT